ncbi:MAG: chorismate mutase [Chloroflexi bacterium]|nr:chorismate mutase [Chloroflexota bacterium]
MAVLWCRGIRGATTVEENTREAILEGTSELLKLMIKYNDLDEDQIAAVTFTTTTDLNAEYPAVAARQLGWTDAALLCGHEMDVPCGLKKVIRILLLVNTEKSSKEMKHVYIKEAVKLRPDNAGPAYAGLDQ